MDNRRIILAMMKIKSVFVAPRIYVITSTASFVKELTYLHIMLFAIPVDTLVPCPDTESVITLKGMRAANISATSATILVL